MANRLIILVVCIISALALPSETNQREKRDVMDTMKTAWGDVVKTLGDAGDAVVHVFKPTEKSTVEKIADSVVLTFQPTEKSTLGKLEDGLKSITQ